MADKNKIKMTREKREELIDDIKYYFKNEGGGEIGRLASGLMLDFIIEKLAPEFYDQEVMDSYKFMSDQVEDIQSLLIRSGSHLCSGPRSDRRLSFSTTNPNGAIGIAGSLMIILFEDGGNEPFAVSTPMAIMSDASRDGWNDHPFRSTTQLITLSFSICATVSVVIGRMSVQSSFALSKNSLNSAVALHPCTLSRSVQGPKLTKRYRLSWSFTRNASLLPGRCSAVH
jgi:uncharacterized protein (DUF2164 family)